jgi:hypothetical protein
MEKFGFSDDEEEDVVLSAAEIKKKAALLPWARNRSLKLMYAIQDSN